MSLLKLGWNSFFDDHFQSYRERGLQQGKVVKRLNDSYIIFNGIGYLDARLTGRFKFKARAPKDFPAIGDWVVFEVKEGLGFIYAVLPRKSYFSRKLAISGGRKIKRGIVEGGSTEEQVIAANIDIVFIVCGLDNDFDLRRIERYLTLAYNSGAKPVIILNKTDVCNNVEMRMEQVNHIAIGVPIYAISAEKDLNMNGLSKLLTIGQTAVFLGSSGVGKSTITNTLMGVEKQRKQEISVSTGKGKHTTTSAEWMIHPSGYMIIDTPGLREVQLWGEEKVLEESFRDVTDLIVQCKFSNCSHGSEPGCAIKAAIDDGTLSRSRYESYVKQSNELQRLNIKIKNLNVQINKRVKRNMKNGF
jgi:ribosome biogenesis GTPase / thiamine phosphate phosphatase